MKHRLRIIIFLLISGTSFFLLLLGLPIGVNNESEQSSKVEAQEESRVPDEQRADDAEVNLQKVNDDREEYRRKMVEEYREKSKSYGKLHETIQSNELILTGSVGTNPDFGIESKNLFEQLDSKFISRSYTNSAIKQSLANSNEYGLGRFKELLKSSGKDVGTDLLREVIAAWKEKDYDYLENFVARAF